MPRSPGKNGPQLAEENVQALIGVLLRYKATPLPRMHGELNRTAIAKLCGFDRKVFQTNPRCSQLLAEAEEADRRRHLNEFAQAELRREDKSKVDKDRSDLEAQNLRLMAENASLLAELGRLRRLERIMTETGRLP